MKISINTVGEKKAYEYYFGCKVGDQDKNGFLKYVVSLVLQFYVNG